MKDLQMKNVAIAFLLGERPSGGPYELKITDDRRWKTDKEYALWVKLMELPDTNDEFETRTEPTVLFEGAILPQEIWERARRE